MKVFGERDGRVKVRTKTGIMLTLKPVSRLALQGLLSDLGFLSGGDQDEVKGRIDNLSAQEKVQFAQDSNRLFNYCAAYGVVEDPPPSAVKELRALGFDTPSTRVNRANWLRYMVLADEEEAGELWGVIAGVTFKDGLDTPQSETE